MARKINEIYQDMISAKESESALASLTSASSTAIWRLMFYVVAVCISTLEKLFDSHTNDVEERIAEIIPGRAQWYANKVLAFMIDKTLVADTDNYDTTGMDDDEIAEARVVKHAVAIENGTSSVLTIKVAGETAGVRSVLPATTVTQLIAYIKEIKYAGVRIELVNQTADVFNCEVDVYYNPQLLPEDVQTACNNAVKLYIENLPFNGEYTNMALIDALQKVDGVNVVEFKYASSCEYGTSLTTYIDARKEPVAGYFSVGTVTINMIAYE
jgi:hypothetical protein